MSQSSSEKKSKLVPFIILVAFIALAGAMFFTLQTQQKAQLSTLEAAASEGNTDEAAIQDAPQDAATSAAIDDNEADAPTQTSTADVADTTTASTSFDLDAALQTRILGNPDAPVKIAEYSSFSCGHCGHFHNDVFKEFKKNWIDTGKAYLVFSDFPLNAPALHASLVGRCVADNDQYFAYVEEVYAKQKDWAYQTDHLAPLKEIAAKYGVDGPLFAKCVQSEELQAGLLEKLRAAQQQFGVNSTPSFVINNAVTIAGIADYAQFNKALEEAVEESKNPPEAEPEAAPAPSEAE